MIENNTDLLKQPLLGWESVKTLSLNNIVKNISLPKVIKVVYEVIKSYRNVLVCIGSLLGFVCVMSYCTNKIKQMRLELEDKVSMKKHKVVLLKQDVSSSSLSQNSIAQSGATKPIIEFAKKLEEIQILNQKVDVLKKTGLISHLEEANTNKRELMEELWKELDKWVCEYDNIVSEASIFLGSALCVLTDGKVGDVSNPKSSHGQGIHSSQTNILEQYFKTLEWRSNAQIINSMKIRMGKSRHVK